jgi:hypothetical protein
VLSISLLITNVILLRASKSDVLKSTIVAALDAGLDVRSVVKSFPVSTDIDGLITAAWVCVGPAMTNTFDFAMDLIMEVYDSAVMGGGQPEDSVTKTGASKATEEVIRSWTALDEVTPSCFSNKPRQGLIALQSK